MKKTEGRKSRETVPLRNKKVIPGSIPCPWIYVDVHFILTELALIINDMWKLQGFNFCAYCI
jgi:hypothetical protein